MRICCLWSSTTDRSCDSSLKAFSCRFIARMSLLSVGLTAACTWRANDAEAKHSNRSCFVNSGDSRVRAIVVYFRFSLRGGDWCFVSVPVNSEQWHNLDSGLLYSWNSCTVVFTLVWFLLFFVSLVLIELFRALSPPFLFLVAIDN